MKRPNITPGPFTLKAGRNIETPSGTFYLAYGRDKDNSAPFFKCPNELTAIAKATAALPALLEALENAYDTLKGLHFQNHDGCHESEANIKNALRLAGYEF
jgi:hypothetical protein